MDISWKNTILKISHFYSVISMEEFVAFWCRTVKCIKVSLSRIFLVKNTLYYMVSM